MDFIQHIHALYDRDDLMINSIKILKKNGINIHEIYSPFPIHHLNDVLELKKTHLSFFSFIYGLLGFLTGSVLTWYTMIWDWPQNIGGKPSFSWIRNIPSFVPVIFELSIFFSAHFMCITYLIQCRLFPGFIPKNPDPRTTNNMFLIEIHTTKKNTENKKLMSLLKKNGAMEVNIKKMKMNSNQL
ncbi:DUF3341 domain-containing protein [Blattabacterium cuenoti]|uniref:DUF3341 domain-containing protein n=1 Tax=Blattabacterium cuenoti TaxID=1653831 RepID=UPI00163B746A|nr:DUF3341 domain-containing protein [Blattabacterium cuenoti]